jgi:ABC-2 type transport system ATP-binding protein
VSESEPSTTTTLRLSNTGIAPYGRAVQLRHVSHRFNGRLVLDDLNFGIDAGEIFGLIGPNGAGKTTTLRVLATLLQPDSGELELYGCDGLVEPERVRPCIGYLSDHALAPARLTVREYLEFFAAAYALGSASDRAVDVVLALTELDHLAQAFVETLSRGQLQQVHMARALVHDPDLLILDEPASHLDPRERLALRDLLLELREVGKTIVLSSHILSELSDICTSVAILEAGRALAVGPVSELTRRIEDARAPGAPRPPATDRTPGGLLVPDTTVRRLRLRTLRREPRLYELLLASPFVRTAELTDRTALVHYVGDDSFVAELVRYLTHNQISLVAVEPEENRLERLFLDLTTEQKHAP